MTFADLAHQAGGGDDKLRRRQPALTVAPIGGLAPALPRQRCEFGFRRDHVKFGERSLLAAGQAKPRPKVLRPMKEA